jgi:hypothetical protein
MSEQLIVGEQATEELNKYNDEVIDEIVAEKEELINEDNISVDLNSDEVRTKYSFKMQKTFDIRINLPEIYGVDYDNIKVNPDYDFRTYIATIAELHTWLQLTIYKFHCYPQGSNGKAPADLIVQDTANGPNGKLWRVSIKATSRPSKPYAYPVHVSRERPNRTGTVCYPFSKADSDILAIYIVERKVTIYLHSELADNSKQILIYTDYDQYIKAYNSKKRKSPCFYLYDHLDPLKVFI